MVTRFLSYSLCLALLGCGGEDTQTDNSTSEPIQNPQDNTEVSLINDTEYEGVCEQDDLSAVDGSSNFTVRNLKATYYSEVDNFKTGQGTNGSDPNISRTYIDEESIEDTRISYSRSEFKGIDSAKLNLVWEGDIEVLSDAANLVVNFSMSYADATLTVNNEVVKRMKNCDLSVPLSLSKGVHSFSVDYHNHWHTTDFSLNISNSLPISLVKAKEFADTQSMDDAKVVFIEVYESDSFDGLVTVNLPNYNADVIVFLSSYRGVKWNVVAPNGTSIQSIYYSSYSNTSEVVNETQSVNLGRLLYSAEGKGGFIQDLTRKLPDAYKYEYGASEITVQLSDTPTSDILYGDPKVILNNLQTVQLESFTAESSTTGQEIAHYLPLSSGGVLTSLVWTAWSNIEIERNGLSEVIIPQDYSIRVYSGDELPTTLVKELSVAVDPYHYYSTDNGNVFKINENTNIQLDPGNYWISLRYVPKSETISYNLVLEDDGVDNGAAFRPSPAGSWSSTENGVPAIYAKGFSLNVFAQTP